MPLPLFGSSRRRSRSRTTRWRLCLAVTRHRRNGSWLLVTDHADDSNAVLRRQIERVEDLAVVEILVGLEVHDFVVARALHVNLIQRTTNVRCLNRFLVQV